MTLRFIDSSASVSYPGNINPAEGFRGGLRTFDGGLPNELVSGTAAGVGASTTVIAAGGAGVRTYLNTIILANTTAAAVTATVLDGASTVATFSITANDVVALPLGSPLRGTANTAWNFNAPVGVQATFIGYRLAA